MKGGGGRVFDKSFPAVSGIFSQFMFDPEARYDTTSAGLPASRRPVRATPSGVAKSTSELLVPRADRRTVTTRRRRLVAHTMGRVRATGESESREARGSLVAADGERSRSPQR